MRTVTEIRHEGLPKQRPDLIQAKVHVYASDNMTELHCFRTLKGARDYIDDIHRRYRFKPLKPEDRENPPDGTYAVWTKPEATIE